MGETAAAVVWEKKTFIFSGGLGRWVEDLVDGSWNTRLEDSDVLMCFSTLEHGYFRSPGRGGENRKIAWLFFIGRTNIRRDDVRSKGLCFRITRQFFL